MASSVSIFKESDKTSIKYCDVCKHQHVTSEAVSYCTSCQEFMCPTCDKAHRGSKLTRDHALLSGSDLPTSSTSAKSIQHIMFCEDHNTMIVNMYCQSHDDVICSTCKVTNHNTCSITDINEQAMQMNKDESFKDTIICLEDLKSKYDKMTVSMIEDKKRVNSELETCLQDMRQIRKDINEAMDGIEKTLSKEIKEINERKSKEVEDNASRSGETIAQISDQLKLMDEYEKTQDAEVMFVGKNRARKIHSTCEGIMLHIQDDLNQSGIRININATLSDIVTQLQSVEYSVDWVCIMVNIFIQSLTM